MAEVDGARPGVLLDLLAERVAELEGAVAELERSHDAALAAFQQLLLLNKALLEELTGAPVELAKGGLGDG